VIGTSSRRREVQIRRLRPDAHIVSIRGNVDTRLRKARGKDLDGVVLAAAGIRRMGWDDQICEFFAIGQMVPSPGQGAIAVQARRGTSAAAMLTHIDRPCVSAAVGIERAFLSALGAGCAVPVGAYVEQTAGGWRMQAMLADQAGENVVFAEESLSPGSAELEAAEIAKRLLSDVGMRSGPDIWTGCAVERDLLGARVVVTRPRRTAGPLVSALEERGATALLLPAIRIEPVATSVHLDAALIAARDGGMDWLVFSSANAVEGVELRLTALGIEPRQLRDVRVAAIGPATAKAAMGLGLNVTLVPATATADELVAALAKRLAPRQRVLYPRSAIGRDVVPDRLGELGVEVIAVDAYTVTPEDVADPQVLGHIQRGDVDGVTFFSPSSIEGFLALVGAGFPCVLDISTFCAGPVTADAARQAGFHDVVVCDDPGAAGVIDAVASHWRERGGGSAPRADLLSSGLAARSAG
jgi:uroporphyrinogen-III synthase